MLNILTENNIKGKRARDHYLKQFGTASFHAPSLEEEVQEPESTLSTNPFSDIFYEQPVSSTGEPSAMGIPPESVDASGNPTIIKPTYPEEEKKRIQRAQRLQVLSQALAQLGRVVTTFENSENFVPGPTPGMDFESRLRNLDLRYQDQVDEYNRNLMDLYKFGVRANMEQAQREGNLDYLKLQDELMRGRQLRKHDFDLELEKFKAGHKKELEQMKERKAVNQAKDNVIKSQQQYVNGLQSRLEMVSQAISKGFDDESERTQMLELQSQLLGEIEQEQKVLQSYLEQQAGREHFKQPEPETLPTPDRPGPLNDIGLQLYQRQHGDKTIVIPGKGTYTITELLEAGATPAQIEQFLRRNGGG